MVEIMSARDSILDALEQILIEEGERSATLDAVAARADVSKGGLLYHFPSKTALVDGLLDRLRLLGELDLEKMRASPDGPVHYYLASSKADGSPLDRNLVAVARLALGGDTHAQGALEATRSDWLEAIMEEVQDPAVAAVILLLGDGLYYGALLTGEAEHPVTDDGLPDLPALLAVVDRLRPDV